MASMFLKCMLQARFGTGTGGIVAAVYPPSLPSAVEPRPSPPSPGAFQTPSVHTRCYIDVHVQTSVQLICAHLFLTSKHQQQASQARKQLRLAPAAGGRTKGEVTATCVVGSD